mgnify:CR=1 FL=1
MPEVMSIEVDEEFDPRPPQTPFGLRGPDGKLNVPLVAGIATSIVLVLLLIFVVWRPFASDPAPVASNWKPADPTKDVNVLPVYPADHALVEGLQSSMENWAKFYTTGSLEDLENTFDLAGPQYALLVKEQPKVLASPDSGPPAVILLSTVGKVTQNDKLYTVRTTITWTKPGGEPQTFNWDIVMRNNQNTFLLNSTIVTEEGAKQPINFCGAIGLIAELDTDKTVGDETENMEPGKYLETWAKIMDIRVRTWSYLQQVAAGTDDQEAVDAIVAEYKAYLEAAGDKKDMKEFQQIAKDSETKQDFEDITERASVQCTVDLKL